ncbi:MAG: ThuA domain-containing protein, partial [Flavobacteriales bacterium]
STANLPDPWLKNEEYYYWEGGYYRPDNVEVLRVEETVGPNGLVNSYDAPRPMSWYRIGPNGSKVFYTALGHAAENYTSDAVFRTHIKDALGWLLEGSTGVHERDAALLRIHPNPASEVITIVTDAMNTGMPVRVLDLAGRTLLHAAITGERPPLAVGGLAAGTYILRTTGGTTSFRVIR